MLSKKDSEDDVGTPAMPGQSEDLKVSGQLNVATASERRLPPRLSLPSTPSGAEPPTPASRRSVALVIPAAKSAPADASAAAAAGPLLPPAPRPTPMASSPIDRSPVVFCGAALLCTSLNLYVWHMTRLEYRVSTSDTAQTDLVSPFPMPSTTGRGSCDIATFSRTYPQCSSLMQEFADTQAESPSRNLPPRARGWWLLLLSDHRPSLLAYCPRAREFPWVHRGAWEHT